MVGERNNELMRDAGRLADVMALRCSASLDRAPA